MTSLKQTTFKWLSAEAFILTSFMFIENDEKEVQNFCI